MVIFNRNTKERDVLKHKAANLLRSIPKEAYDIGTLDVFYIHDENKYALVHHLPKIFYSIYARDENLETFIQDIFKRESFDYPNFIQFESVYHCSELNNSSEMFQLSVFDFGKSYTLAFKKI